MIYAFISGILPTTRPPTACGFSEATCANGECIDREGICDGDIDCSDRSDEASCRKLLALCGLHTQAFVICRGEQLV